MGKNSATKLIFCEVLGLHFKRKNNNIKRKRFWLRQFLWKDIRKESFMF